MFCKYKVFFHLKPRYLFGKYVLPACFFMLKCPLFYKIMVIKDSNLGFFSGQLIRNRLAMPGEVYTPIESGKHSGGPRAGGGGHSWSWVFGRGSWKGRVGGSWGPGSEELDGAFPFTPGLQKCFGEGSHMTTTEFGRNPRSPWKTSLSHKPH